MANKIEIERVVSNIIDNSIKALNSTKNPKIDIQISTKTNFLTLEITDNGTGIDLNLLSILGKFRVEKISSDKSSNGIGVMHSKRVIEKLGGNFEISNNKNTSGASVKISLKVFN